MTSEIKNCLPPDRNLRKPKIVLPKGSIDTHVHLFDAFGDWVSDPVMRHRIMVDTPAAFYRF